MCSKHFAYVFPFKIRACLITWGLQRKQTERKRFINPRFESLQGWEKAKQKIHSMFSCDPSILVQQIFFFKVTSLSILKHFESQEKHPHPFFPQMVAIGKGRGGVMKVTQANSRARNRARVPPPLAKCPNQKIALAPESCPTSKHLTAQHVKMLTKIACNGMERRRKQHTDMVMKSLRW